MLLWSQSRPSGPLTDLQVPLGAHLWRLDLGPGSYAHSELSPQQQLSGEAASSAGLGPCHSAISSSPLPHLCLFTFSASPLSSFSFSCLFHYRFLLLPFFLPRSTAPAFLKCHPFSIPPCRTHHLLLSHHVHRHFFFLLFLLMPLFLLVPSFTSPSSPSPTTCPRCWWGSGCWISTTMTLCC